jgi:hypothetical protein
MHTFFVTFLQDGINRVDQVDWAEVHAENVAQVAEVAENHGWRIMSIHDTACWRLKLRIETRNRLELLELDRFLHYHRRGRREDPDWLALVRQRADGLRRSMPAP